MRDDPLPPIDELFSAAYEELRRLATRVRRDEPGQTLNPTALVNEAYLKLAQSGRLRPASPLHFRRLAARAMRQVLVEAARRRRTRKRGGELAFVTLDEAVDGGNARSEDLLALDRALDRLVRVNPRQAALIEYRFFGGFELSEVAALLEVSESTLLRDWRAARAWLALEMRRTREAT